MKQQLRTLFSPLLKPFESGTEEYVYKPSHRKILIFFGCLLSALALLVFYLARDQALGYLFPVVIFGGAGLLSLLIGLIGTDRAVAKIWGSR